MNEDQLVGRIVYIHWFEEEDYNWNTYRIIGRDDAMKLLLLEGIPEDGIPFEGGPSWVGINTIDEIEILDLEDQLEVYKSKMLPPEEINELKEIYNTTRSNNKLHNPMGILLEEVDNLNKIILNMQIEKMKIESEESELEIDIENTEDDGCEIDDDTEEFDDDSTDGEGWKK